MEMKRNHINYISLANVVSAIAVILLHTNGVFWIFSTEDYWKSANIIESVFYFAVPVFFMLTGATLIDYRKRYSTAEFLKRRLTRTVIPYLFWSMIELVFSVFYLKKISLENVTLKYVVNGLLTGSLGTGVLWFFIPLFAVYLSIPLFSAVPEEKRTPVFGYLAVLTFVFNSLIPFVLDVLNKDLYYSFSMPSVGGYLFYCIVGYLLVQNEFKPLVRSVIYFVALVGLAAHMVGTYVLSMNNGSIINTYKGYLNVPCIVYSVGVFVFLKYAGRKLLVFEPFNRLILFLKNYTLPCYLIHQYIRQMLVHEFPLDRYSLSYRLLSPVLIVLVVIPVTWFLRKIPLLRKVVP